MANCERCGYPITAFDKNGCTTCAFWDEHANTDRQAKPHQVFIAEGSHYLIGEEPTKAELLRYSSCYGYGGAEFRVKFHDGTTVVSHNVWCQGDIPDAWKSVMPDNATIQER